MPEGNYDNYIQPTTCAGCVAVINEPAGMPLADRSPCLICGSKARNMSAEINEVATIREKIGLKQKRPGYKKPIFESVSGDDQHRATGQWNKLTRAIDCENDHYSELIVNPEKGEVIRECDEPLTVHVDRGSARQKSGK